MHGMAREHFDFSESSILITGGASGIGRETALLLASLGGKIVVADIQEDRGARIVQEIASRHGTAAFIRADVTEVRDICRMVDQAIQLHGGLDVLVNCAGVTDQTPLLDITLEEWERVLRINLTSTFVCSQLAFRHMVERRSGVIINVASSAGKTGGIAVGAHYSASKAGVICLTKSFALSGAPYRVRVNCVCPGTTNTPMIEHWSEEARAAVIGKIPLGRLAEPLEVANAICFLASPMAQFITGEIVDVNGGMIMD